MYTEEKGKKTTQSFTFEAVFNLKKKKEKKQRLNEIKIKYCIEIRKLGSINVNGKI